MGATFSRIKNWTTEVLSNTDLNAEIDNILNNLTPSGVDDYSASTSQMRLTVDPGELGSESLATSLAGELERLRFVIKEIKGGDVSHWYQTAGVSLSDLSAAIGTGSPNNRIASGKESANSSQLLVLDPDGATTSLTFDCNPTNFVYYINGTQYSITADFTVTGLSAAPSTNNTAAVNDANCNDDQYTKFLGEYGTEIKISGAGSEIASSVGKFAAFALNNGSATEYFMAYVNSTTSLTKAWRGCFFNSSQQSVPKLAFAHGDSLSLLKLTWVFVTTASSAAVTYNTPNVSGTQPSSPSTGDYWFDLSANVWKRFNSTTWEDANATLIGMCAQNTVACVAARTFDSFIAANDLNNIELERLSTTGVGIKNANAQINIFGSTIRFGQSRIEWNMASHLDSGVIEAANTYYYLYLKETGTPVISDLQPSDRRGDLGGLYHPSETWRCVGVIKNDGSSNFDASTLFSFREPQYSLEATMTPMAEALNYGLQATAGSNALTVRLTDRIGNYPSNMIPVRIPFRSATAGTGTTEVREINDMLRITIPTDATLGHGTIASSYVFVYAIDHVTASELGVSSVLWDDGVPTSWGAITTSSRGSARYGANITGSNLSYRHLGHCFYNVGLNGTWSSTPARVVVGRHHIARDTAQITASSAQAEWGAGSSEFFDLASLALGPGDYSLSGILNTIANGAITVSFIELGISTTSGNDPTGLSQGLNLVTVSLADTTSGRQAGAVVPNYEISLTSATTHYLKGWSQSAGGNLEVAGYSLRAVKKTDPKLPT